MENDKLETRMNSEEIEILQDQLSLEHVVSFITETFH